MRIQLCTWLALLLQKGVALCSSSSTLRYQLLLFYAALKGYRHRVDGMMARPVERGGGLRHCSSRQRFGRRALQRALQRAGDDPAKSSCFSLKGGGRRRFRLFGAGTLVWLLNLACVHPYRLRQGAGAGQSQPACNSSRGTCQPLGGQHCHWQVQRASLVSESDRASFAAYVVEFVVEI